jgi:hypothetical protein
VAESIQIALNLTADELDGNTFRGTVTDLLDILKDVEEGLTQRKAKVKWQWDDEAILRFSASPNGLPESTLLEVVRIARNGFEKMVEAEGKHRVDWPQAFGNRAKRAVRSIIRRLDKVEAITIQTPAAAPLFIDHAILQEEFGAVTKPRTYTEFSSVDGMLDLISVRGRPHFVIQDHNTARRVRCTIPDEILVTRRSWAV